MGEPIVTWDIQSILATLVMYKIVMQMAPNYGLKFPGYFKFHDGQQMTAQHFVTTAANVGCCCWFL